ncbi:MAG: VOC family protein [Thiogranum sp.]|nr:VOC family protein [Thiogranum sp.]
MDNFRGIHHGSLIVADLAQALRFYVDVLGMSTDPQRPDLGFPGAWLQVGEGQQIHLLVLAGVDPVEGRPAHVGRDRHLALRIRDLEMLEQRLNRAGVAFTLSRSGRRALFCRDPDGNGIELIESR